MNKEALNMADEIKTEGNEDVGEITAPTVFKAEELPEEAVTTLIEAGPAEYGKAESAKREGIMGLELSKGTLLFYGVRSFVLALIIVAAFAVMNVKAFMSGDPELMSIAMMNMREIAYVVITAFFVAKAKSSF